MKISKESKLKIADLIKNKRDSIVEDFNYWIKALEKDEEVHMSDFYTHLKAMSNFMASIKKLK